MVMYDFVKNVVNVCHLESEPYYDTPCLICNHTIPGNYVPTGLGPVCIYCLLFQVDKFFQILNLHTVPEWYPCASCPNWVNYRWEHITFCKYCITHSLQKFQHQLSYYKPIKFNCYMCHVKSSKLKTPHFKSEIIINTYCGEKLIAYCISCITKYAKKNVHIPYRRINCFHCGFNTKYYYSLTNPRKVGTIDEFREVCYCCIGLYQV